MAISKIESAALASGVPSRLQLPAGTVLQVVQGTYSTQVQTSSSTYTDTGLSATITPTSTTSKILILVSHPENWKDYNGSSTRMGVRLYRNGTNIYSFAEDGLWNNTAQYNTGYIGCNYLDSPATTSAIIYKTMFKSTNNTNIVSIQGNNLTATIILMEIAA